MSDQDIYAGLSFESELRQIGIDQLRVIVQSGAWKGAPYKHGEAIEVVRRFDAAGAAASAAKRDTREEETLTMAKDALAIAKEANRIASEDLAAAQSSAASSAVAADAAKAAADAAKSQARWAMWAALAAVIAVAITTKDQILALLFGNP